MSPAFQPVPRLICLAAASLGCTATLAAAQPPSPPRSVTIATGVPLHIVTTVTTRMRVGAPVQGTLTQPVWVADRLIFPCGTPVHGHVAALEPQHGEERLKSLLNGDMTPLKTAVVQFDSIQGPQRLVPLSAEGRLWDAQPVSFVQKPKQSLRKMLTAKAKDKVHMEWAQFHDPGKKDRVLRLVYNQLPYHPQSVWQGTGYVADLTAPVLVQLPPAALPAPARAHLQPAALVRSLPPDAIVQARLTSALDSDTSKRGDLVSAIVTQPMLDAQKKVVLPEGAELQGIVTQSKPSRSLGRNGALRFNLRTVRLPGDAAAEKVHGTLTGAAGSVKQNLSVDEEGDVKANPDKNRFLAPILLGALAVGGHDHDHDGTGAGSLTVRSNGLGFVGRLVTLASGSSSVASGIGTYGFAKSIYFRFLTHGHPVTFPTDTPVEWQLSAR